MNINNVLYLKFNMENPNIENTLLFFGSRQFINQFINTILENSFGTEKEIDWNNKENIRNCILEFREFLEDLKNVDSENKKDDEKTPGHKKNSFDTIKALKIGNKVIFDVLKRVLPLLETRFVELGGNLEKIGQEEEEVEDEQE